MRVEPEVKSNKEYTNEKVKELSRKIAIIIAFITVFFFFFKLVFF